MNRLLLIYSSTCLPVQELNSLMLGKPLQNGLWLPLKWTKDN